jgi:uncharacterized membrane protein (DUF441 family)
VSALVLTSWASVGLISKERSRARAVAARMLVRLVGLETDIRYC